MFMQKNMHKHDLANNKQFNSRKNHKQGHKPETPEIERADNVRALSK